MNAKVLRDMPVTYESLVLETTNRCPAKCAMCYQSAGPGGSESLGFSSLSLETLMRVIEEAPAIPSLKPHLHFAGGEAFVQLDDCLAIVESARRSGFLEVSGTTNAFWARNPRTADSHCQRLRSAGLTRMEISWDAWHRPFVPPDRVDHCVHACRENGIETVLRILSSRKNTVEGAIQPLANETLSSVDEMYCSPVSPIGRAAREISPSEVHAGSPLNANCHQTMNLAVNAFGNVFPCCAGIDQTDGHIFGNVRDESIVDIAERMNSSPLLRTIVFGGVGSLVPILENAGHTVRDRSFASICHLCWWIFSDPERAEKVTEFFSTLAFQSVQKALKAC